ncbi:lantibiotic dehydratase [Chryseobacterium sp.]|uniref:lantibiotic dehydratase n=1 Tax=Chryseobacterium sp. TaxID=1871047 RepID=UPI002FCC7FC2
MYKYETYNKYVIRKPLFSYDILFNNNETKNINDVVADLIYDDAFVTSIYWSSPDLYETIIHYREKTLKEDKVTKLLHTLKKYVIRASTRCTPYGTMAGVALNHINNTNPPSPEKLLRKARIDMDFLSELIDHIENNEDLKKNLRYKVNNTIAKIPGQFRYQEPIKTDGEEKFQLASLEINDPLELISELVDFKTYEEIVTLFPDFDEEEISDFLNELINIKLLVSELQPGLTVNNLSALKSILQRLLKDNISSAGIYLNIVSKVEECIHILETTDLSYLPTKQIHELKSLASSLDINKKHFFHVDLKHSPETDFNIDDKTLRNINTSLSILDKFRSKQTLSSELDSFKKNFREKYESREVPLTEVLDSEFGIGFPSNYQIGNMQTSNLLQGLAKEKKEKNKESSNLDFLLDLIEKTKEGIIRLEDFDLKTAEELPIKIQNSFIIGSPFQENFFLQNIGTAGAGSILGRFALIDEKIEELCNEIQRTEQEQEPEIIFAEVIYIPEKRAANIARRPRLSEYEIPIFANSNDHNKPILLKDILVSIEKGEIILRSEKLNKRIVPRLSNAHNFHKSESSFYKFLCAIQYQNQDNLNIRVNYSGMKKRFFPRIAYRNIILHRACWFLQENDMDAIKRAKQPLSELKIFIQKWNVAKYVVLVQGDNELFLDTTNDSYLLLLIDELKNNKTLQLSEWLQHVNESRNYSQQIILPLINKNFEPLSLLKTLPVSIQRSFAPGSEWLYLKIYCNSNISDHLLSIAKPLLYELIESKAAESFFFIRYTDPHHHIRLRINLAQKELYAEVLQRFYEILDPYFQEETVWNLQIDSYHREIERYHSELMAKTEVAFYYDSLLILHLMDHENFMESEEIRLFSAVKNVEYWLSLFGLSLQEKLDFCKSMENVFLQEFSSELKSHINSQYRLLKDDLYSFFENHEYEKDFNRRNKDLIHLKLCKENVSSYIHMSINRWFSSEQRAMELMVYSFTTKYYNRILSQSR